MLISCTPASPGIKSSPHCAPVRYGVKSMRLLEVKNASKRKKEADAA